MGKFKRLFGTGKSNDLNVSFVEGRAVKSFEFEFIW
jgi:hypothetical protein